MGCGHELSIAAHKTGLPSVYAQYQIFCSHYDTICKKSQNLCSKQRIFMLFFYSVACVSPAAGHQLAGYQKKRAQPSLCTGIYRIFCDYDHDFCLTETRNWKMYVGVSATSLWSSRTCCSVTWCILATGTLSGFPIPPPFFSACCFHPLPAVK